MLGALGDVPRGRDAAARAVAAGFVLDAIVHDLRLDPVGRWPASTASEPAGGLRGRGRGLVVLRALAAYLMTICFALAGNRVLTRVRAELYRHLNALSLRFHDRRRTGDLVTRVTGDIGRLQELTVTARCRWWQLLTLLAMLVVIAIIDWQLALVVLLSSRCSCCAARDWQRSSMCPAASVGGG